MSRFWSPGVGRLIPYVAGEQVRLPRLIKLNTNESPYGPAPEVLAAIRSAADDTLRLYPDPEALQLRQVIAARHGLHEAQVFVGNGSDEVLAHAFMALLGHGEPVLFPDVSYSFYPVYCRLYGIPFRKVPVTAAFEVDVEDYVGPCGGVVLPNPNAPTGIALALDRIERLLALHRDRVVVVDEAYVDFGAQSAVALIERHANLLIVQTVSKSRGLAGLRVGHALGSKELIDGLNRVKGSFNSYPLDRLALAGATASFAAEAHFRQTCDKIVASRERLVAMLQALGFDVLPSSANFVFARHPGHDARVLMQALRARSILVRHLDEPRIEQHLRITVGTDDQCARLAAALRQVMAHSQQPLV